MLIGEYRVERLLGGGGQGEVYAVHDPRIPGKLWALKLVRDPGDYRSERRALADLQRLNHPAIPRLANSFGSGDKHALVMTHFPGATLQDVRLEWRALLSTLHRFGDLLSRLHSAGWLYLDLKPQNIIRGDDAGLYLVDYALVQSCSQAVSKGIGTPGFAAPEQLTTGQPLEPAADVYALGALGYYLLSGNTPDPHNLPPLPNVPPALETLLRSLVRAEAQQRAGLESVASLQGGELERSLLRCRSCGAEARVGSHVCPSCGLRLSSPVLPLPDFRQGKRVLPPTVITPPGGNTNVILNELVKPSRLHDVSLRDLQLKAEEIARIRGFNELHAPARLRHLITFYPHQLETGTRALQEMRGNAILADEVGLGKTIEAGLVAKELILRGLVKRALILVPGHLVDQWVAEMEEKFNLPFKAYSGTKDWGEPYLVASISAFARRENQERVLNLPEPYRLVIVDEMHNLLRKNGEPKVMYEGLTKLPRDYTLLLSATYIKRHLHELYYLVNLIRPGQFLSRGDFESRFSRLGNKLNAGELRTALHEVIIRHHRGNLPTGSLPPPRRVETRELVPTLEETRLSDEVLLALAGGDLSANARTLSALFSSPASQGALLGREAPDLPCNKLEETLEILKAVEDKAIIFTRESSTAVWLEAKLKGAGYNVILFKPGLSRAGKAERFYRFKRSHKSVLVATDAGAEGRNLQFAQHLINFDIPWNPLRLEQRMGRIDRLGQKRTPKVYNLLYAGSFEGEVYRLFDRGLRMFELIIGELASVLEEVEEFGERSLDDVITDLYLKHLHDPQSRNRALNELSGKLMAARGEFDREKHTTESIDKDLF